MRQWTPKFFYDAKPWLYMGVGAACTAGATFWSLSEGSWSVLRGFLCLSGAALAVIGGATLQMRQDYRAKSKWRREKRP